MIPRILADKITQWSREYPVVTVTGPRQSGKSTFCKALFPDKPYVSLEESSLRLQATEDPRGFLARYPDGAILDEIQRVPELSSYIQTIVDSRDRPGMFILTGSQQFELMAGVSQSLAGRNGQILNASSLAGECGISHGTARGWISVLQQSALVYLLKPYYRNLGKRLVKSPKLYFLDTGLLCWLLNIFTPAHLDTHPLRGAIFEAYVVAEFLKSLYNRGKPDTLLYFRDQKGHEVDLLSETQAETLLCEIKSSATFHPDFIAGMNYVETLLAQPVKKRLVMGSPDEPYWFKDTHIFGYSNASAM